jgi:hypothetical protein
MLSAYILDHGELLLCPLNLLRLVVWLFPRAFHTGKRELPKLQPILIMLRRDFGREWLSSAFHLIKAA